ncbi:MAG: hypothetical protein R3B60_00260 [Candidatus Paceibacterota bacterium]
MKMKIAVGVLFILGCLILLGDDPANKLTNLELLLIKLSGLFLILPGVLLLLGKNKKNYVDYCKVGRKY